MAHTGHAFVMYGLIIDVYIRSKHFICSVELQFFNGYKIFGEPAKGGLRSVVITAVILDTFLRTVPNLGDRLSVQVVIRITKSVDAASRSQVTRAADETLRADALASAKSKFFKLARVNKCSVVGLIDSGRSAVLIRVSTALECKIAVRDRDLSSVRRG